MGFWISGFLDFVKDLKSAKMQRLFPELKKSDVNGYGFAFTKKFKTYRENCGVTSARDEEQVNFHSFWHTFTTRLAEKGVPEEHRAKITGHSNSDSTNSRTYTHGFSVKELYPHLEKLIFDVDMNHLSYDWYKEFRHRWYKSTKLLRTVWLNCFREYSVIWIMLDLLKHKCCILSKNRQ